MSGESRIRTCEVERQRIYSPSQLAALVSPQLYQYALEHCPLLVEIFISLPKKEVQNYTFFLINQTFEQKRFKNFKSSSLIVLKFQRFAILELKNGLNN